MTFGQSPRWNYYARSVEQNDWTITQITMFQHDSRFLGFTESNNKHEIVLEYKHGMVLEYNHRTKNISVMYYDFGLTLRDWQIAQGALEGRNVYFAQELNGRNLTRRSGNIIRYFVSLIPNSERITDLWDQLRFDVNEELGQRYSFIGSNYDDQVRMHNGNVYRSVSGNLGQWEMSREGAHVNFTGDINAGERSISLRWSYRGNIASNL